MKTTDFEVKITKKASFTLINYRLTLISNFSTETFFTVIVSVVLRLQNEYRYKREDRSTCQRPFCKAGDTLSVNGRHCWADRRFQKNPLSAF
jgi:hypothetical protein